MAGWNDNGRGGYGGGGYNNNRSGYSNSYNGNRSSSGSYNSRSSYGQQKELPPEITPKKVPEDYVDEAERIMRSLMSRRQDRDHQQNPQPVEPCDRYL